MKKLFLSALILAGVGMPMFADNEQSSFEEPCVALLEQFYGAKARDSYKNPCKGETIRICGTRLTEMMPEGSFVWVTETVTDDEDNILYHTTYKTSKSVSTITDEILSSLEDNETATIL